MIKILILIFLTSCFNAPTLQDKLVLHLKWLKNEKGGVSANLESADLTNTDLFATNLTRANLTNIKSEFKRIKSILGYTYPILITDNIVKVGCKQMTYAKWKEQTPEQIKKIADDAAYFYPELMKILDTHFKRRKK